MTDSRPSTHLLPSELGTKEYWDDTYARELANHAHDPTDEGTVWFADSGAEEKMVAYLDDLADTGLLLKGDDGAIRQTDAHDDEKGDNDKDGSSRGQPTSFLDLGCGNGHLLFALRDEGWTGRMVGIDYSGAAVRLARAAAEARATDRRTDAESGQDQNEHHDDPKGRDWSSEAIHFAEHDIFSDLSSPPPWLGDGFDVVLDKGTFDAVSLSDRTDERGQRLCEGYRERVEALVRPRGLVLVTSCNWTEEELRGWFEGGILEYYGSVPYPKFVFGGKSGQTVVSLCFRRKTAE